MHGRTTTLVLDHPRHSSCAVASRLLALSLTALAVLQAAGTAEAQSLDAEPLFGSVSLEAGFSSSPYTVPVSPGGEDPSWDLGNECFGYIRFAQPDFLLSYQAGTSPLGIFAVSDLDVTLAVNDPAGNWHCNDDSAYLSGTNSGIQFDAPASGDYQIWVGSYDSGAESIATMLAITEADTSAWAALPIGIEDAVYAASFDATGAIIFGDDSSGFANDDECDDPRFQGQGAVDSGSNHLFKDASDCRALFEAGMISLAEPEDWNLGGGSSMDMGSFGGDMGLFGGAASGSSPVALPDAGPFGEAMAALIQAFRAIPGDEAGAVPLPFGLGADASPAYDRAAMTELTGIDFGDNSGPFTDDGECDDPRFEGPGAAAFSFDGAELTDGGDCSSLFLEGALTYLDPDSAGSETIVDSTGIDFGDNSGMFADDGECDDPRFEGAGAAAFTSETSQLRDANDCRSQFEAGRVSLMAAASAAAPASSAPTTSSTTRSSAPPPAPVETYTIGVPRGDVNGATREDGSIFASGTVYGDPTASTDRSPMPASRDYAPTLTRPIVAEDIDFGDNSSAFANDGECDDPRFEGDGAASINFDDDLGRDANDCRAAFEAGTITLIQEQQP